MKNKIIHTFSFKNLQEYKLFTLRHGPIRTKTLPPQPTVAILSPVPPPFELEGKFLFQLFYTAPCPCFTLSRNAFYILNRHTATPSDVIIYIYNSPQNAVYITMLSFWFMKYSHCTHKVRFDCPN
jgi:hypothetical protein